MRSRSPNAPATPKGRSSLREWVKAILFSALFVVTFRGVVAQAYQIPTGSMENTLLVGDYLFVNKMLYGSEIDVGLGGRRLFYCRFPAIREPRRGDVIVFRSPENPRQDLIKRCVAVAGQTILIRDKVLFVDGVRQEEPYAIHIDPQVLPRHISQRDNFGPYQVPARYIFMMGDNRDNSWDSRFWGPLDVQLVRGKATVRYWSWDGPHHSVRFDRLFRGIS